MAACLRKRERVTGVQVLRPEPNFAVEMDRPLSDEETVTYCVDCSSGAELSPCSEQTAPTATSSWDEDFNAITTAKVQQTLDAVDNYLYEDEETTALSQELKLECDRWKQRFPYFRVTGTRITSPMTSAPKNVFANPGSASTESKCDTEPGWSAEDEALKSKVVDELLATFWPEVQLWLDLSRQRCDHDHFSLRQSPWELDEEADACGNSLEGVLTVTPKLLRDRFSERACSSTTLSSRSSTARSLPRQRLASSEPQGPCGVRQWPQQPPVSSKCVPRQRPLLPSLSSGGRSSSSSHVPMSSISSRTDRTSSGSSSSKLPPIDSASLLSMFVEGRRINVTHRPLSRSVNSSYYKPKTEH